MSKPWWQSRTIWVNGLTLAATILTTVTGVLPPAFAPWITVALTVVNLALRVVTTLPLE